MHHRDRSARALGDLPTATPIGAPRGRCSFERPPTVSLIGTRPNVRAIRCGKFRLAKKGRLSLQFMPWVRALLHGQVVFARARPDGSLLVAGDRVEVCYSPNASRLYRARARNVVRQNDATVLPDDACAPRLDSAPRLKSAPIMMRSVTKKPAQSTAMPKVSKDTIVAFADGACSGNPGPAGLGVVVLDAGTRTEISEHLGQATNNIAEL